MADAKKGAFLAAFARLGTVTHAADAAGVSARNHGRWLLNDPDYPELFKAAQKQASEMLEREAIRRAVEGYEKPVYQGGKLVGTIREYSDTLLIFLMKGAMPGKYRERVEIALDVRREAERVASEYGLEVEAIIAEAERIVAEAG